MDSRNPADAHIENQLDCFAQALEDDFDSDVLALKGAIVDRTDDLIRNAVEGKRESSQRRAHLTVVLTTPGGYIDVVHRIVDTMRYHYEHVNFVVPNHAFSAGTVLTMSGDAIFMDYYSRLGPIDPQVQNAEGRDVPALGYLVQWERLLNKAKSGNITLPEIEIMQSFDLAELYKYEQERNLSIELLEDWLTSTAST